MYLENFPEKLKKLRLSNNLTQSQLAEILETTKQAISAYESGKIAPSLNSLIKLSENFNIYLTAQWRFSSSFIRFLRRRRSPLLLYTKNDSTSNLLKGPSLSLVVLSYRVPPQVI